MTPPLQGQQTALQTQISALGDRMEKGFTELKEIMTGVEGRVRGLETREAGCQPMVIARLDASWRRLDDHEAEIRKINELIVLQNTTIQAIQIVITELKRTQALLSWLGGVGGSGAIIWLLGKILGLIA